MIVLSNEELTSIVVALKNSQKANNLLLAVLEIKVHLFEKILIDNAPELIEPYERALYEKLKLLKIDRQAL